MKPPRREDSSALRPWGGAQPPLAGWVGSSPRRVSACPQGRATPQTPLHREMPTRAPKLSGQSLRLCDRCEGADHALGARLHGGTRAAPEDAPGSCHYAGVKRARICAFWDPLSAVVGQLRRPAMHCLWTWWRHVCGGRCWRDAGGMPSRLECSPGAHAWPAAGPYVSLYSYL